MTIFDDTICALGEGPLWHPLRGSLFWFDILNARLYERRADTMQTASWQFDEIVSAAGWIDERTLLIASETALLRFDLTTGAHHKLVALEADITHTRSNDGRADPFGGFWIGTMGKNAQPTVGAIYRYYKGELTKLFGDMTITNSICFAPDGRTAYFTDTPSQKIMKVTLDNDGWPIGAPELFVNVAPHNPDGSVVDAAGNLWNAQWGASRVACYTAQGTYIAEQKYGAEQTSCPAFGGADLKTLFVTSAAVGLESSASEQNGMTWQAESDEQGQPEYQVKLG